MTTLDERQVACPACGALHEATVVMSTSSFGACDLDTRPASPQRYALEYEVWSCSACGLHYPPELEVGDELLAVRALVAGADYRALRADDRLPALAARFLAAAQVVELCEGAAEAGWYALRAAWACDDAGDRDGADRCREQALALWESARADPGAVFLTDRATDHAIVADVQRRRGRFTDALAAAAAGLAAGPDEALSLVLERTRAWAEAGDRECHAVDEEPVPPALADPVDVERHPYGTKVRDRFTNTISLFGGEGSETYAGDDGGVPYVVIDEGTLADFMDEDDDLRSILISVLRFATPRHREAWVRRQIDVMLGAGCSERAVAGARRWLATRR